MVRPTIASLVLLAVLAPGPAAQQVSVPIDGAGAGPAAPLEKPWGHVRAPGGELYVAGQDSDNLLLVDPVGQVTEVFRSWPALLGPSGLAMDSSGSVYVASFESDGVLRVHPEGTVEPVIFSGGGGRTPGLDGPLGLTVDTAGRAYVAGRFSNNLLRVEGDGSVVELVDSTGAGPGAPLLEPRGVAVSGAGMVYVTGMLSDNVLRVDSGGDVTEVLGPAGDGSGHPLNGAIAAAVAPDGTLYVASFFSNTVFRRTPAGVVSAVITSAGAGFGQGLSLPVDLALAPDGTLFVAGLGSDNVLALSPGGVVSEVLDAAGDGAGHSLDEPTDVFVDASGVLWVASAGNSTVLTVDGGTASFFASVPDYGAGTSNGDGDILVDAAGRLVVASYGANEVRRFDTPTTTTLLVDDSGGPGSAYDQPYALALDPQGRVVAACHTSSSVLRLDGALEPDVLVGPAGDGSNALAQPYDLLYDDGTLYVAGRSSDNVFRVSPAGDVTQELGPADGVNGPTELALGDDGTLYVANKGSANLLARRPDGAVEVLLTWPEVHPGNPSTGSSGWYRVDVDPLGRVFLPGIKFGELHRLDPDGTLELLWVGDVASAAVDDGGAVTFVAADASGVQLLRMEPSGAVTQLLGPDGDGAGHVPNGLGSPQVVGPGRVDVSSPFADTVFHVDLGFCGGWSLLNAALPDDGSGPLLTGEGALCGGSDWLVQLSRGAPGGTAQLVLGLSELSAPFKGGTLVPMPDVILPQALDANGAASLSGTWPTGLPSGASIWLQAWVPATGGFRASNGLRIDLL